MGEAVYYLIAEFRNNKQMKLVSDLIEPIIKELSEYNDYWQSIRDNKTMKDRRKHLEEKFPLLAEYLPLPKPVKGEEGGVLNYLAGHCDMTEDYHIYEDDIKLTISCEVWHFANWKPLVKLMFQLGALRCNYYSDEYVSDLIEDIRLNNNHSNTGKYPELDLEKLKEDIMVSKI